MLKVYYMDCSGIDIERALPLLSEERRQKISRLPDKNKLLSAGAELLLIHMMKERFTDIDIPLEFSVSRYGKKSLPGYKGFCFNLSHSGSFAACAVSDSSVGVDIERVRLLNNISDISKRIMTDHEYISENGGDYFFKIWVKKEAVQKLDGRGAVLGAGTFDVSGGSTVVGSDMIYISSFEHGEYKMAAASYIEQPAEFVEIHSEQIEYLYDEYQAALN